MFFFFVVCIFIKMANIEDYAFGANIFDPQSPAPTTATGTTSSGPTDAQEPDVKIAKLEHALVADYVDVKVESSETDPLDLKAEPAKEQPSSSSCAGARRSDTASSASRSSAKTRRARALLEAEQAEAEVAAARVRVAKAKVALAEAEESDEERERIERQDTPILRPMSPPGLAPAIVLPTPLNMPTIYHTIGKEEEEDVKGQQADEQNKVDLGKGLGHFMEEKDSDGMDFFQDALDAKEEDEARRREQLDDEYRRLNQAQHEWAREREHHEQAVQRRAAEAQRLEAEKVAQLQREAQLLEAKLRHEAELKERELESTRVQERMKLQRDAAVAQQRLEQEAAWKAHELEKERALEAQRLQEQQRKMEIDLAAAQRNLEAEARRVAEMRREAERAMAAAQHAARKAAEATAKPPRVASPPGLGGRPGTAKQRSTSGSRPRTRGSTTVTMTLPPGAKAAADEVPPPLPPPPIPPKREQSEDDKKEKKEKKERRKSRSSGPPSDDDWPSGGSSSPSSSTSYERPRRRCRRNRRKSPPSAFKVKSADLKLNQWPTTLQFPAWRRALRSAVAGACDRPIEATAWIFEVEVADKTLDDFKPNAKDRFRALDAKLADALNKVTKGEPARKIGIEAEKAALSFAILTGRQHLLLVYKESAKDDNKTDHVAYSNLENLKYNGTDPGPEGFVNLWDSLLMSFRTSPTEAHLYSALHARLSTCPGLKTTIEHLDRQSYGHPDKNYEFLMSAARHMIENRRTARQTAEYSKTFRGTATRLCFYPTLSIPSAQPLGSKPMVVVSISRSLVSQKLFFIRLKPIGV